jgi:S1-C subfamily serine protease
MKIVVILLAVAAAALGCYDIANPYRADQAVTKIYPGSPVERAGLRTGDTIPRSRISVRTDFDSSYRRPGKR